MTTTEIIEHAHFTARGIMAVADGCDEQSWLETLAWMETLTAILGLASIDENGQAVVYRLTDEAFQAIFSAPEEGQ